MEGLVDQPPRGPASDSLVVPPEGTAVYRTRTAIIWVGPEDIVRVIALEGSTMTGEDAYENLAAIPERQHKKRPVLVDARGVASITREARQVYRGIKENPRTTAVAILVDSPLSRVVANFFIGLSRMYVPTRLFTSAEEAIAWLAGFRL
jgi:hypothetical protein